MHPTAARLWAVLAISACFASVAAQRSTTTTYTYLLSGQQCGGSYSECPIPGACRDAPWSFIACAPGTTCKRTSGSAYWRCLSRTESRTVSTSTVGTRPGASTLTPTFNTRPLSPSESTTYTYMYTRPLPTNTEEPAATPRVTNGDIPSPTLPGGPTTSTPSAPATITTPSTAATSIYPSIPATIITPSTPLYLAPKHPKTADGKPSEDYREVIAIDPNTKVSASPNRPNADRPAGTWIPGRATYYGVSSQYEQARLRAGKGEPGQFGVIEDGSCGYTEVDSEGNKRLPYPIDAYVAAADTNIDYPGTCGRCYQIRCRTGFPENDGKPLKIDDLEYYDPPRTVRDDQGRAWPGNPYEEEGMFYTQCWDQDRIITVKVGDSCPCIYKLKDGTVRRQWWCCGGNNHFDLSYWAFTKLMHPTYGVMKMEYRPVDCQTGTPLDPVPGFVDQTIYSDDVGTGWGWRTYGAKNTRLLARGEGLMGSNATCATLSKDGAIPFFCRECTRPGYQPFAKAKALQFWIRSDSSSTDPFESSTPYGRIPGLKIFLMGDEKSLYCGAEVVLGSTHQPSGSLGSWYRFDIPLTAWACDKGSAGSLANINRVDFQNINIRDANVCLDEIALI